MAHIENKDIRKELRFAGSVIRKIMPVFTKEQLVNLSTKCEKFLTGKWLGKHTSVETQYIDRPDGTKIGKDARAFLLENFRNAQKQCFTD